MPTGIGNGIAGDVFQNNLGAGGGGGLVCPSRYSWQGDGVLFGPCGFLNGTRYTLGTTNSSASIWYKPIDIRGTTDLGAGLYSTDAGGAYFSLGTNIYTSASGVLTASLGPMIFPAHPELITNGSFTEVPVGAELIANPTFSDAASITPWNTTGAPNATLTWNARFMRMTYTVANGVALFDNMGQTLNTMYSVKMRVRGVTSAGADQGSAFDAIGDNSALTSANIISNPTLTYDYQDYEFRVWSTDISFRFYLATAAIGDVVDFDSISVKPLTMLVDNGNFTDTGSELVSNGDFSNGTTDWTAENTATISVGTHAGRDDVADINITGTGTGDRITQPFTWTEGKSYKVDVEVYLVSGSFRVDTADGFVPGNFVQTTTTGSWQTLTGYITATDTGSSYLFVRSSLVVSQFYVDSVSVKELGADWTVIDNTAGDTVTFGGSSATWTKTVPEAVYLQQDYPVTLGASHKLTYTVLSNTYTGGGTELGLSSASAYGQSPIPSSVGTHTVYLIVSDDTPTSALRFYSNDTGGSLEITNIDVEELGEDWTLGTGWSIGEDKAISTGSTDYLIQSGADITDSTSYKISWAISDYISGSYRFYLKGQVTSDFGVSTHIGNGSFTTYLTSGAGATGGLLVDARTAFNGSITNISVSEVLSEDEWHHLALSIDRDSEWKWYVDGVLTNTMDNATDVAPFVGLHYIGLTNLSGASFIPSFYGNMTEPSLWNIPLSSSEVKDIYDNMYGGQKCLDILPFSSDLITNGNFSQIGPELILNPNFTNTGSELVVNGDFLSATSWNVNSNWNVNTVLGVAEADGTSDLNLNQNVWLPVIGKSYKVTFEVVSRSQGEVLFKLGGVFGQAHTTLGIKTEYIVATSTDRFNIDSQSLFIGSVTNVSVKELGADWTLTDSIVSATPEGIGYYTDDGGGVNAYAWQTILDVTKNYKTSFEILEYVAGAVGISSGTTAGGFYPSAVGVHEKFLCPPDGTSPTQFKLVGGTTAAGFKMTNASVKEVGQGWDADGTGSGVVTFPNGMARIETVAAPNSAYIRQYSVMEVGKSYTMTYRIVSNNGGTLYNSGQTPTTMDSTVGSHSETFIAGSSNLLISRSGDNTDVSITNVTLTQVGSGNLERWWRMNGTEPLLITLPNVAPNGIVNDCIPVNAPIIQPDTP